MLGKAEEKLPGESLPVHIVALDVDGTVLTPEHTVAHSTREAVAAAEARGITIVLSSSRSPKGLRPILDQLGLHSSWFIAYQGALVGRWVSKEKIETLSEVCIDDLTARRIEERALDSGLSIGRYTGLEWRVPVLDSAILREAGITGERPLTGQKPKTQRSGPHKLMAIAAKDDRLQALEQFFSALPRNVTAAYSHRYMLEVTAAGVHKGFGVGALAAELGIEPKDISAIGDGLNDISMFAVVGYPIAMGHAPEEVISAASWTTTSNTHDGVARALARMHLKGS